MTQLNSLMRNYGTIQNSMELLMRPIALSDREGAGTLAVIESRIRFDNVRFHYTPAQDGDRRCLPYGRTRPEGWPGGSVGCREVHAGQPPFALLRPGERAHHYRWPGYRRSHPEFTSGADQRRHSGYVVDCTGRSATTSCSDGPAPMRRPSLPQRKRPRPGRLSADLKDQHGRSGLDAHVGERGVKLSRRPAPAYRHRAGHAEGRADSGA